MIGDNIFANQDDLEQLIGSNMVTAMVLQKRYKVAVEENERLQKENEELRAKLGEKTQ